MTDADPDPSPPSDSDGSATSPAPEPAPADRSRRLSRRAVVLVAGGLAVLLVAAALLGAGVLGWWPGEDDPPPPAAPSPTAPPDPFAGTPAEDFAEGEAGIVLPEPEPVGEFSAEEVAEALDQVREALIAARLDPAMLIDHDPDRFLSLLAPDHQPGRVAEFETGAFTAYATQISPDATLAQVPPRVAGEISYDVETVEGGLPALSVTTAFVWVYGFEPTEPEPERTLVVIQDVVEWEVRRDERWLESSRGLWLVAPGAAVAGAECGEPAPGLVGPLAEPVAELNDSIFQPEESLEPGTQC